MRSRGEIVGAVDFGAREIRVVIARLEGDGSIEVVGHGAAPGRGCVSQGVIQDRTAAQNAFKHALNAAQKEARVKVDALFCGVNGRSVETFIREGKVKLERGLVEASHLAEARDIAARDILAAGKQIASSITAQEWYVDDMRVVDPRGLRGQVLKTRVHFARLPIVIEDNIVSCIESQRREMEDMIFLPLASALGCLTPEDMELGVALLDLGRSTTGLAVYSDHRIHGTHCFEWGSYYITRDVAAGLQVSFDEADELILEYGISDEFVRNELMEQTSDREGEEEGPCQTSGRAADTAAKVKLKSAVAGAPSVVDRHDLDIIISERAKEMLVKVRQLLHARGLNRYLVRGVVLTGGASLIKNYAALAEAVFQTPCRVGRPDSMVIRPPDAQGPAYSAVVGIVRHAFEYRSAARNGRVEPHGGMVAWYRRMARFLRKYFF